MWLSSDRIGVFRVIKRHGYTNVLNCKTNYPSKFTSNLWLRPVIIPILIKTRVIEHVITNVNSE